MSNPRSLFEQIRRRRVLQIVVVYAGAAWVLTEASQFLVDNYDLPRRILDAVVYLLIVGFPAAAVLAWYHGERGPQRPTRMEAALLSILAVLGLAGAYQIITSADADGPSAKMAMDLGDASVAVIPFDNQISDPELDWLGQGLAELLTTGLAQLDAMRVVSGQRLFDLLRQEGREGIQTIPDDLAMRLSRRSGARYMVRGTVLGTRDDMTLTASLIDVRSGEVAAAARVRGTDAFSLVDRVSAELSSQILEASRPAGDRAGLLAAELAPVADITTRDIEAYRAYQLGLQAERRFRWPEARIQYERAIQLDTTFALAYMQLGLRELDEGNVSNGIRQLQLAKQNLTAASERDRLLIDGLIAAFLQGGNDVGREKLGELVRKYPDDKEGRLWLWQLSEGEERRRLIEEAIRLDPYYAVAYNYLAYHLADVGEFSAADSAVARYAELEPGEPNPIDSRGEIAERAGRYEEAREAYREALRIEPTFVFSLDHLVRAYLREGKAGEARAELETYLPGPTPQVDARVHVLTGDTYAYEGSFDEALQSYYEAAQIGITGQSPSIRMEGLTGAVWLEAFLGRLDQAQETAGVLHGIDPFSNTALHVAILVAGERGDISELEGLRDFVIRLLDESEAIRELGMDRFTPEVLEAILGYYRGQPAVLVDTLDRLKAEVGAPLDAFVNWQEVWAHLQLGNGHRALELVTDRRDDIRWESRYLVLDHILIQYEEARAHELLDRPIEAEKAYERLIAQLGDALAEVPRLADTPQRLARLKERPEAG